MQIMSDPSLRHAVIIGYRTVFCYGRVLIDEEEFCGPHSVHSNWLFGANMCGVFYVFISNNRYNEVMLI